MCVPPRNKPQIPCSCSFNVKAGVAGGPLKGDEGVLANVNVKAGDEQSDS